MDSLRLIVDGGKAGDWNMAVDQAILETADQSGAGTLRFYRWEPATLSLGYFQSLSAREDHEASLDCPVVRRASGGGAILHDHELTYSLVLPARSRWSSENERLYQRVHEIIVAVLGDLGVRAVTFADWQAEENRPQPIDNRSFLCFERRSDGDLIVDGWKICGSAQRRLRNSLLQHGSLLLAQSKFAPELPGLNELGSGNMGPFDFESLSNAIANGLAEEMQVKLQPAGLTDAETSLAKDIVVSKFGNLDWTGKRK